jgi:hypothetical protein
MYAYYYRRIMDPIKFGPIDEPWDKSSNLKLSTSRTDAPAL